MRDLISTSVAAITRKSNSEHLQILPFLCVYHADHACCTGGQPRVRLFTASEDEFGSRKRRYWKRWIFFTYFDTENNPAVININTGIESMRHNVQTTVNSVLRGLQIAQSNLERQARKFEGRISSAPQQEKEFLTISRQQEIKATLYIMLLQKREENAITLASTANNGRIIKAALPRRNRLFTRKSSFDDTSVISSGCQGYCVFLTLLKQT